MPSDSFDRSSLDSRTCYPWRATNSSNNCITMTGSPIFFNPRSVLPGRQRRERTARQETKRKSGPLSDSMAGPLTHYPSTASKESVSVTMKESQTSAHANTRSSVTNSYSSSHFLSPRHALDWMAIKDERVTQPSNHSLARDS